MIIRIILNRLSYCQSLVLSELNKALVTEGAKDFKSPISSLSNLNEIWAGR